MVECRHALLKFWVPIRYCNQCGAKMNVKIEESMFNKYCRDTGHQLVIVNLICPNRTLWQVFKFKIHDYINLMELHKG